MSEGRVYLVGAGPGDPGLLTVRGRDLLARADAVVYDALVEPVLLDIAPAGAERIFVGKRPGCRVMSQERINGLLIGRARAGATVVRLKGGDPFVFGRGGEEAVALAQAGVPCEVVPGVTAGIAAPAYAGIPVTDRNMAGCVTFITGREAAGEESGRIQWNALARTGGTLVLYMAVGALRSACTRLIEEGLPADTPAAVVQWGTTARQKTVTGTVASLAGEAESAQVQPPAVVVIGPVASLRSKLMWFEKRPLLGRVVVLTRPQGQGAEMASALRELGAEVVHAEAIRIEPPEDPAPLKRAARAADGYDWIVFASVNAVTAFFEALAEAGLDARSLGGCRIAAIGPATAQRVQRFGVRADVRPDSYTTAGLVAAMAASGDLRGRLVLCPRSDVAPNDLVAALAARGASARQVVAYRTVLECRNVELVVGLLKAAHVRWLTFASASEVRSFLAAVGTDAVRGAGALIATIGPATSAEVRRLGLAPSAEARTHTGAGLIEAILEHEASARKALS